MRRLLAILFALPAFPIVVLNYNSNAPPGRPIAVDVQLPPNVLTSSLRVRAGDRNHPVKIEHRERARLSWISSGAPQYTITFDIGGQAPDPGLTLDFDNPPEPAMVGTGDPVTYGKLGVRSRLGVGLWAHPAAIDMDLDGDLDVIVSSTGRPSNGIWQFTNLGAGVFSRGRWLGPAKKDLVAADFNGDGKIDLVSSGGYYSDVQANLLGRWTPVNLPRNYPIGRDDLWHPVDWDGDGKIDVLTGVSDWSDYGWDDAFDSKGAWTRGQIHGYIYFHRNQGSNQAPAYAEPVRLPYHLRGSPAPNPVDWFGNGTLHLIAGEFVDTVQLLLRDGGVKPLFKMDLCMIQPRLVDWHGDGRISILIGEEDGAVSLAENQAPKGQEPKLAAPRYLIQVEPYVKSGVLSRPVAVDWNGDGKLDMISGNSAGYIQYFENAGTKTMPAFEDRGNLSAAGKTIRRIAGPNGSVQGPIEEKWGYSNPWPADWDLDGKLDILVNDIWGSVHWYRNTGNGLAAAQDIEVDWDGPTPKPDWVWWQPKGKQLVTQWRTTPRVVDWNRDGLPDLVMLDHRGYLALYRRARVNGELKLLPPERIFVEPNGRFLSLAAGRAGRSGRRKIDTVDWDKDGTLDVIVDTEDGAGWYRNIGSQEQPILQYRGSLVANRNLSGHNPTPNAADWNGDGKLDLLIGAEDGLFYYYDRTYLDSNPPLIVPKS